MNRTKRWFEDVGRHIEVGFRDEIRSERPRTIPEETRTRSITSLEQLGSVWQKQAEIEWLVPNLLAEGSVNLLSSESGTGKTWLAYFLAGCVAHGRHVFGNQATERKVLYLDGENPLFVVKDRLANLGIDETPNLKIWGGWESDLPPGPDSPLIVEFAKKERPLLIWDSLVEFHTGDEQSATATRQFMRQFRHLANLGAAVLVLHHMGKADSAKEYRGSSDIKAVVDMGYKLVPISGTATLDKLALSSFKSRFAEPLKLGIQFKRGQGFIRCDVPEELVVGLDPLEIIRKIVETTPGLNQSEIVAKASEQDISKHKVEDALRESIFEVGRGRGSEKLYYLASKAEVIEATPPPAATVPREEEAA